MENNINNLNETREQQEERERERVRRVQAFEASILESQHKSKVLAILHFFSHADSLATFLSHLHDHPLLLPLHESAVRAAAEILDTSLGQKTVLCEGPVMQRDFDYLGAVTLSKRGFPFPAPLEFLVQDGALHGKSFDWLGSPSHPHSKMSPPIIFDFNSNTGQYDQREPTVGSLMTNFDTDFFYCILLFTVTETLDVSGNTVDNVWSVMIPFVQVRPSTIQKYFAKMKNLETAYSKLRSIWLDTCPGREFPQRTVPDYQKRIDLFARPAEQPTDFNPF